MKKTIIWIVIITVIVVLIGAVIAVHFWFEQPGIRVLGNDIHVELNEVGYIIDGATGEITGQTPVDINGSTSKSDTTIFDGELTVMGYQNTETGTITATKAIEKTDSGFYLIHHIESCTHSETENGITQDVDHFCDYFYTYYVYPENEDFLVVKVEDFEEDTPVYVVCADSEEQALESYSWFMENQPK